MTTLLKWLGKLVPGRSPLRPPGALPEKQFFRQCIKCNKCVQICPYQSIVPAPLHFGAKLGTPVIMPRTTPCYVCMKCPPVCPTGALDNAVTQKEQMRLGTAEIDRDLCFAYNGIICRSCFERCPIYRKAITLRDELFPEVHADDCTGCGICENVCPTETAAITVISRHVL